MDKNNCTKTKKQSDWLGQSDSRCLDTIQINRLEQSFREWAQESSRANIRLSRKRILLIFLLIRYTGARLNEVLALNPLEDIDHAKQLVVFGKRGLKTERQPRQIQMSEKLSLEIYEALSDGVFRRSLDNSFDVDPGHVRRKFYERAVACGFPKELGAPDAIRKSRAVELMQSNMPLSVVQKVLGKLSPKLTASYIAFSDKDTQQITKFFLDKESGRKTSARNIFFGKICRIQKGDIQSIIELITIGNKLISTVITNDSLARLGLKTGTMIKAEVKAPWVILQKRDEEPECSAENIFRGTISRVTKGKVTTEYVIRVSDKIELCSIVTSQSSSQLNLKENDPVWAIFNSFSVVLHTD
ncbi:MAG: tyrosine-type recombinase/integrase [Desulfobacterium sp.]|nr:tyrosine-type recombinase/integrase [Desulfobacterium sp.]MBU3946780.1 TOBE domain-containing protein [Pseudomonadota bacterium]MBU4009174.1 TOBE domain-containing protein [Pseudomonadota bacterium]MBU4035275.1 TOBE domain-containing protein [Pseudomonadota bacterium]